MRFDLIGNVGRMSYRIADDMLKERSKGPGDREQRSEESLKACLTRDEALTLVYKEYQERRISNIKYPECVRQVQAEVDQNGGISISAVRRIIDTF